MVNPATLAPQQGQSRDLCLNRRLRTVETTGDTVILQQDDSESIGTLSPPPKVPDCTLPWLHVSQRYAIDQDSVRNVASPQAYAYAPGNTVDRSPAYSVNLPLGTGNGPYLMWDDATGSDATRSPPTAARPLTASSWSSSTATCPPRRCRRRSSPRWPRWA